VHFADGASVEFDPIPFMPKDVQDVDHWMIASNEACIVVPHKHGWFEIPWDVIRRHTDPEFAAHWAEIDREHAERFSAKTMAVREESGDYAPD
jgi:hypothetical protein